MKLCEAETPSLGVIRVELWPEGLVLWVGGEMKWNSWSESRSVSRPLENIPMVEGGKEDHFKVVSCAADNHPPAEGLQVGRFVAVIRRCTPTVGIAHGVDEDGAYMRLDFDTYTEADDAFTALHDDLNALEPAPASSADAAPNTTSEATNGSEAPDPLSLPVTYRGLIEALKAYDPSDGPGTYVPRLFHAQGFADHLERRFQSPEGKTK